MHLGISIIIPVYNRSDAILSTLDSIEHQDVSEDIEILSESKEGYVAFSDRSMSLALNTQLSDKLVQEGLARELVNRIQNLRKEAGFEVTDRIKIQLKDASENLINAVNSEKEYICTETLADEISTNEVTATFVKKVEMNNEMFTVGLLRN